MEDGSPNADPGYKLRINGNVVFADNVENGIVEEGDETGDTNDCQWLRSKSAEDESSQRRCKESFVDAKEFICAPGHV